MSFEFDIMNNINLFPREENSFLFQEFQSQEEQQDHINNIHNNLNNNNNNFQNNNNLNNEVTMFFQQLPQIIPMTSNNMNCNHISHMHPDMFNTSSSSDEFTPENSSPIQSFENNMNGSNNNTSEEDEEDVIKVDKSAKKGKRGRKPSLVSGTIKNIKVDPNFVELPLEALYKFDSDKMETYLKQLLLNRKLSSEEEGELKKN